MKLRVRQVAVLLSIILWFVSLFEPSLIYARDCSVTGEGYTPLTDLGTGTYTDASGTYTGGLYSNGQNTRSTAWEAKGQTAIGNIYPRDSSGNRNDSTGKIVLASIGMSNATMEFGGGATGGVPSTNFMTLTSAFSGLNSKLTVVDAASAGETADIVQSYNDVDGYWQTIVPNKLNNAGVTDKQVQAVWLKEAIGHPTGTDTIAVLKGYLESIVRNIKTRFPNVQVVYISSRIYGGYTSTTLSPEPSAYESGFGVQQAILDQINGAGNLNYDSNQGTVVAPWMSWGPYLWADGTTARKDGLLWNCDDVNNASHNTDGTHPSRDLTTPVEGYGIQKVANDLFAFFVTDTTTSPWFLSSSAQAPSASSPWTQSNWDGGPGQAVWGSTNKFINASSLTYLTSNRVTSTVASNWYNASWSYRKKITFDNHSQTENLTNFPVMVKLSSTNFDFTKGQSAGQDLRFTDSDGTTLLSYEIETWDSVGQTATAWVKVPQIDGSSGTDYIYMYYGNASASDAQSANNVWNSNYKGRWHLNQTAISDGTTLTDSTSNNQSLTSVLGATSITGQAGSGLTLNGSTQYLKQTPSTTYDGANVDTHQALFNGASNKYLSQGFQVASATTIGNVRLSMRKVGSGSPTTTHMAVRIETDSAGKPSGTLVTNGTSKCVAVPTSTTYGYVSFKFTTDPAVSASTQYHIVLKPYTESTCTTEQSSQNGATYISWGVDGTSSSYTSGDSATATSTPTWTTQTGIDHGFEIYANTFDLTSSLTIGGWVKRASSDGNAHAIFSKGTMASGQTNLGYASLLSSGNKFQGEVSGDGSTISTATSSGSTTNTNWHFVQIRYTAVTNNTSLIDIFADGTTNGPQVTNAPTPLNDSIFPLLIGTTTNDAATLSNYWSGSLDELFVTNTALSADWIAATYLSETNALNTYASEETQTANSVYMISSVFDSKQSSDWGTLTWSATVPSNTTLAVKVRTSSDAAMTSATAFASCGSLTSGTSLSSSNCVNQGDEFAQYEVLMTNTDNTSTATFSSIALAFSQHSSTTTTTTASSSSDSSSFAGWTYPILAGPHHSGEPNFVHGIDTAGSAMFFATNLAHHDDLYVEIHLRTPTDLATQHIPFPWAQGFNTAGPIYQFQAFSSFNGYPITTFDSPVSIFVPFTKPRKSLRLAWYNPDSKRWKIVSSPIVHQSIYLITTVKRISYFAVVY